MGAVTISLSIRTQQVSIVKMYLFKGISLISILLSMVSGAPTLSDKIPESFEDALKSVAIDTGKVIQSTSDVIDFIAKKSAEAVSEAGRIATEAAEYALPKVDLDLLSDIDLIAAVNQTEEYKIDMIKSIYDAKRKAINTLNNAFYNASIVNLDVALTTAQEGISVSQKVITDLTKKISLKNAQEAASATQVAIVEAIETSREMIESTGKSLLKSLVDAKQQLHVAAKGFDSEEAFRQGQENLAKAVNIAFQGTETLAKNLGVFESLNKIIHSLAEPLEKK